MKNSGEDSNDGGTDVARLEWNSSSVSIAEGESRTDLALNTVLKEGPIQKWGNFVRGYSSRWLVLYPDRLAYYRNRDKKMTCKGSFALCNIEIQGEGNLTFVISNSDDTNLKFKAESLVSLHEWIGAIEIAKAKLFASRSFHKEEALSPSTIFLDHTELHDAVKLMSQLLDDLKPCERMVVQHHHALKVSIDDLQRGKPGVDHANKLKDVHSKLTLFFWSYISFLDATTKFVNLAKDECQKWKNILDHDVRYNKVLEDMVETMATQQKYMEQLLDSKGQLDNPKTPSALDIQGLCAPIMSKLSLINSIFKKAKTFQPSPKEPERLGILISTIPKDLKENAGIPSNDKEKSPRVRRTAIPERAGFYQIKFWNIIKNNLYKDCMQMPIPVWYLEPLSMLQRLTGIFDNSRILDAAAECQDRCEQMAYVASFVTACHSDHKHRVNKPFTPLLGETYECDRMEDLGWRAISEMVSKAPPIIAQFCEGRGWALWQNLNLSSKFLGKTLEVSPNGVIHLTFDVPSGGGHYTWNRIPATVHNIIIGQMYISYKGSTKIINHKNNDHGVLKFFPPNFTQKKSDASRVIGVVKDGGGKPRWLLNGVLDDRIEGAKVILEADANSRIFVKAKPPIPIWVKSRLEDYTGKMYYFGKLDAQLNEEEAGVAPTDSRLRPDIRTLENGNPVMANKLRLQLEKSDKKANKRLKIQPSQPLWFKEIPDPIDPSISSFQFEGKYWDCKKNQNWKNCPDIFTL